MLGFCPDGGDDEWRMCPLQEKGGRTFGVLLSGGTIFKGSWLIEMAKLGGQMLEKVWRREQLETLIKVSQASLPQLKRSTRPLPSLHSPQAMPPPTPSPALY